MHAGRRSSPGTMPTRVQEGSSAKAPRGGCRAEVHQRGATYSPSTCCPRAAVPRSVVPPRAATPGGSLSSLGNAPKSNIDGRRCQARQSPRNGHRARRRAGTPGGLPPQGAGGALSGLSGGATPVLTRLPGRELRIKVPRGTMKTGLDLSPISSNHMTRDEATRNDMNNDNSFPTALLDAMRLIASVLRRGKARRQAQP